MFELIAIERKAISDIYISKPKQVFIKERN